MKFNNTLTAWVTHLLNTGTVPMLLGEPGIGKSSWTEALAEAMHTKCFTLPCNQLGDVTDLTGARMVPVTETDKNGNIVETGKYKQVFFPHAIVTDAIEYAQKHKREYPILFLDELNRTSSDITSALLSIPTLRRLGNADLPSNLRVMVAGNDKGNITSLDSASISRFSLIEVEPDTKTFLALDADLNPFIRQVLEAHPETIFCKELIVAGDEDNEDGTVDINEILDEGEQMSQFTTPRTISAVSRLLNDMTSQEIIMFTQEMAKLTPEPVSVLAEMIYGCCGHTAFSTFLLEAILNNLSNLSNSKNSAINIAKPRCYDELKNQKTVDELNAFIQSLDDRDKSGALTYALYEKEDNSIIIRALSQAIDTLESDDVRNIMKVASASTSDGLDEDNIKVLLDTQTKLSSTLSVILNNI